MELGFGNRTAIITGASGGIGQAIARQFVAEGANVVVHCHRNRKSADAMVSELGTERAVAHAADLTDEAEVAGLFQAAVERFGSLHMLVANAGVWPESHVPIHEMSVQQWQSTMDTNLKSVFLCCRFFIQQVAKHDIVDPSIVMIGSTAGIYGEAGHGDYAATKSALISGLTRTLKNEIVQVARLGRVNTVSPGWVMTPMAKKFAADPSAVKKALSTIALRKVASPEDISNAVAFLSSSAVAGHITGQALTVSGGMEGRRLYDDDELAETALP